MEDINFQTFLYKDENTVLAVHSEKIDSYFDRELKINNEVFLLDFQGITPGDYQLQIKSPEIPGKREIKVKIIQ